MGLNVSLDRNADTKLVEPGDSNEFFMGEVKPTIGGNVGESYIEDSKNFEQHYYQDVLKPHKLEEGIRSHL
jgi:hypothetical protein